MKKILFLCFSVLFTNLLLAQGGTVEISGSPTAEVGVANTYTLKFTPTSPSTSTTTYTLNFWSIVAPISGNTIQGNINNQSSPNYFYNQTSTTTVSVSNTSTISIPITFGDQAFTNSQISVYCSGFYRDGNSAITGNISTSTKLFDVRVYKINTPTISNPTILNCCTNNVQFCATDFGDANQFTWSISGGTIASGQGTSCVTITPNANGNITANCVVRRSAGLPNYTATNTRSINRTARTASFTGVYSTTPPYNYICKGSGGRQMSMASQCGFSSVNWVAPNCTITGQGTLTPTITPLSTIPTGSSINIYAVVSFVGGCTATTPNVSFQILDSTTAPIPAGNFTVTPNTGNICTAEIFELTFNSTNGFNNGVTTFSPQFLWGPGDDLHYRANRPTKVTVCNKNLCTGLSTCKTFTVYPPAPCSTSNRLASTNLNTKLVIAPNPTNGNIIVTLPESLSGNYQVYDQTNTTLVQEARFDNQSELQIDLSQRLKAGIYILKVISENNTFTEKIILNK